MIINQSHIEMLLAEYLYVLICVCIYPCARMWQRDGEREGVEGYIIFIKTLKKWARHGYKFECVDNAHVLFVLVFYPPPLGQRKHEIHGNEKPFLRFQCSKRPRHQHKVKRSKRVQTFSHRFIWQTHKWCECRYICWHLRWVHDTWMAPSQAPRWRRGHVTHQNMIKGAGKLSALRPGVEVTGRGKPRPGQVGQIHGGCGSKWIWSHFSPKDSTHWLW